MADRLSSSQTVTAQRVKRLRLVQVPTRPQDAVIEIETGAGVSHFVLKSVTLVDLAEKIRLFAEAERRRQAN